MKRLSRLLPVLLMAALAAAPAGAQSERQYGEESASRSTSTPPSVFKSLDGVVVKVDVKENALYFSDVDKEQDYKVPLDDSTTIRIEKKKGGPELLASLTEGMAVRVTVNTETGVAVSVKVKKQKG